jgi:hypothetical protein
MYGRVHVVVHISISAADVRRRFQVWPSESSLQSLRPPAMCLLEDNRESRARAAGASALREHLHACCGVCVIFPMQTPICWHSPYPQTSPNPCVCCRVLLCGCTVKVDRREPTYVTTTLDGLRHAPGCCVRGTITGPQAAAPIPQCAPIFAHQ